MRVPPGTVALVTGASRGIGRAVAEELARQGSDVVLVARSEGPLRQAASEIVAASGRRAFAVAADLRSPREVERVAATVEGELGRLDILVNNAGAVRAGHLLTATEDDWADGFALKLFGYVRMCRALWPMLKASQGSVVNIIGTAARTPSADFAVGSAVNAAVAGFTKALAETGLADGVRVNAVHPGPVLTARLARLEADTRERDATGHRTEADGAGERFTTGYSTPEDCAHVVAFLASPAARRVVGEFVTVDGGMTRSL
jgi:NAD(P)-dependent dehydrogenase (short-subunit alcohol dehydrogenase family)